MACVSLLFYWSRRSDDGWRRLTTGDDGLFDWSINSKQNGRSKQNKNNWNLKEKLKKSWKKVSKSFMYHQWTLDLRLSMSFPRVSIVSKHFSVVHWCPKWSKGWFSSNPKIFINISGYRFHRQVNCILMKRQDSFLSNGMRHMFLQNLVL